MDGAIVDLETVDLRFPTSRALDGSDAMNEAPDCSAAYVVLRTGVGLEGHGFSFTIGRGNELAVAAAEAIGRRARGWPLAELVADPGGFARHLQADSQLRRPAGLQRGDPGDDARRVRLPPRLGMGGLTPS
jgi:L-fuconate dehydratase